MTVVDTSFRACRGTLVTAPGEASFISDEGTGRGLRSSPTGIVAVLPAERVYECSWECPPDNRLSDEVV